MPFPKYDLHCHSTASDGVLSPPELVRRAAGEGVEVLALTDHDSVAGIGEGAREAGRLGIRLLSGVELTASWAGRMVHLVGLGFDPVAECLRDYLEELDHLRLERAERLAGKLMRKGMPDLLPAALEAAGDGQIGRPHFARALVDAGLCDSEKQAFQRYLGTGKLGDVRMPWPEMARAIGVLHDAGGLCVLAHPTKYRLTFTRLRTLINDFCNAGGDAIEVAYAGIKPEHQRELLKISRQRGLKVSAGSDFHRPGSPWCELGRFLPLEADADHVLASLL